MSKLKNGETILFTNKEGTTTEYNNNGDGTYTLKGDNSGEKLSKNRIAEVMGLPGASEYDYGNVVVGGAGGPEVYDYDNKFGYDFIKMTEEDAEEYLKKMLPEGFTYDQYGMGDAIKVSFGNDTVAINLQPNDIDDYPKEIKKIQDFIKKHIGDQGMKGNNTVDMGDGNSNE